MHVLKSAVKAKIKPQPNRAAGKREYGTCDENRSK